MKRGFLISLLVFMAVSCKITSPLEFSVHEKKRIGKDPQALPMRVLLTTHLEDSLFLRKPCQNIVPNKDNYYLQHLIQRMHATMIQHGGIGIAANQVGIGRNLFLITRYDKPNTPVEVIINPKIINHSTNSIAFIGDGCLSIPGKRGTTNRHEWVLVGYYNEQGQYIEEKIEGYWHPNNFTAIIFQHEYDHLQGILFVDRLYKPN